MKKLISLLLVLCFIGLVGCGGNSNNIYGEYKGQYTNDKGDLVNQRIILRDDNSFYYDQINLNAGDFGGFDGTYTINNNIIYLNPADRYKEDGKVWVQPTDIYIELDKESQRIEFTVVKGQVKTNNGTALKKIKDK